MSDEYDDEVESINSDADADVDVDVDDDVEVDDADVDNDDADVYVNPKKILKNIKYGDDDDVFEEDDDNDNDNDDMDIDDGDGDGDDNDIQNNAGISNTVNISNYMDVDTDTNAPKELITSDMVNDYINKYHPECIPVGNMKVKALTKIVRDESGKICDKFHKTLPYLTKYEITGIIAERSKQLESNPSGYMGTEQFYPFNPVLMASHELVTKKIPFIVKRPLPDNTFEYWNIEDLELLTPID